MLGLLELLGDDLDAGLRVQEAVSDDLAHDFPGAAVIGFGASALALQGERALVLQPVEQLEVARLGIAELRGGLGGAQALALAFKEPGQLEGDFVIGRDEQRAGGAGELGLRWRGKRNHGEKVREWGGIV